MSQEIITEAITLFVIINPIGAACIFLALTPNATSSERRRVANKTVVVAAGMLIAFIFVGRVLLDAMGISITAFQIAGGIILFVFGLSMILDFATDGPSLERGDQGDVAVYPLAMPMLAGPGSIMTVVLLSDDDRYHVTGQATTVLVLLGVLVVTYGLFRLAMGLQRFLGETAASIVKRIMGLLLCAVAVDKALSGIAEFCRGLPG